MSNNVVLFEDIDPSDRAIKNICDSKKFCKKQGKITFGQLKALVENAKARKILTDVGEGGYKATLRLLPWFFPQLAIAGFTGSVIRAFNKIFRPALEDTTGYKTWWGKTIMKLFNLVEGDLGITDPLSKIFFISDGLLTMLDNREKTKFARHIAEVATQKPDDEEVPEYFVENELRHWLNERFLLDPPLQPKVTNGTQLNENKDGDVKSESYFERIDNVLTKFISTIFKDKSISNFSEFRVLSGYDKYDDLIIRITGLFKEPFNEKDSDIIRDKSRELVGLIKKSFPFTKSARFYSGSMSTIEFYEKDLDYEKKYLNRQTNDDETELPFVQEEENGIKRRLFSENVNNDELKWHFDELDREVKIVKSNGWQLQMDDNLPFKLVEGRTVFIPKGVYHRVIKGKGDLVVEIREETPTVLLERNQNEYRMEIRKIVGDIVKIFKREDDGEYYLPEDLGGDEMVYEFNRLGSPFVVELTMNVDETIETFQINAALFRDDDTIQVVINYNPENKKNYMYELIGSLNEHIAHELRHIHQQTNKTFNLGVPEEENPYKYYTQPHEIDAQLFGFKRLSKITNKPLVDVITDWFETNRDIHQLNDIEIKKVIKKLLKK